MKPASRLIQNGLLALTMLCGSLLSQDSARADVKLPAIFGSHMVLQRDMNCKVWGWADASEKVTVSIDDQSHTTNADAAGNWSIHLDPMSVGKPRTLEIQGKNKVVFEDVLVGEVWICSGQSNMGFTVSGANDSDLEILTADYPEIRLISVPQVGTQEPQKDFKGQWEACTPESVKQFSAVGYFYGRQLYQTLKVPIGLIDNAWGGSAAEAWVRRDVLESHPQYAELLARWEETESTYDWEKEQAKYADKLDAWKVRVEAARKAGKPIPAKPRPPRNVLEGQHRPANIYNGVLLPTIGYGIRGVIWYQGESNSGRAYQYRDLFPLMISFWREQWGIGDFPFYWVQLADFQSEVSEPQESAWAELREAQTMTMEKLPHTGQAVIYDLGEAEDIHPRDKQNVAKRLARWALANEYGIDIPFRSPEFKSMEKQNSRIELNFDHVGGGLDWFDTKEIKGFAIAGEDRQFRWATALIVGKDQIEVWSDEVSDPVAVRYAWASNPVANVQNVHGLKLTPFRTDEWPGVTAEVRK